MSRRVLARFTWPRWATLGLVRAASVTLSVPTAVWASHRFNDVPDSHTFHNAIDWMADNGITVGCNPPDNNRYCPEDPVTRGEMAAFIKRLAEAEVVDAGSVDGWFPNEFARFAGVSTPVDVDNWDGSALTDTVTMLAPDHGFLVILYSVNLGQDNSGGGTSPHRYQMAPMIDGTDLDGHALVFEVDFGANANDTTESLQRVINVAPGTYQVGVRLVKSDTIPELTYVYDRSLTVLYIPFGGGGVQEIPLTQTGEQPPPAQD